MSNDPPNLEWTVHDDQYFGDLGPDNHELPHLINSYIGSNLFHDLSNLEGTRLAGQTSKAAPLEHINTFFEGYNGLKDAADDVAVGHHNHWQSISAALHAAHNAFNEAISATQAGLTGATASAMFQKAQESLNYLGSLADAAARMDPLVDTFSRDIKETKDWFISTKAQLDTDAKARAAYMGTTEDEARKDLLAATYDREAQRTIHTFYNPPIEWISQRHPDMSAGPPQLAGSPAGSGAPSAGGGPPPGGLKPGGLGAPEMPSPVGLGAMNPAAAAPGTPTSPANALQGMGDAAKGAGDAANKAGQQAQNAAGQAGNAANQALGQLPKGGQNGAGGLPEGVLGLGPQGLKGATSPSGSGARAGGVGGTGARSPVVGKPSAQLTQASKATTAAPVSRSSVSTGSGGSGAGAPVAGQRGAQGADKEHKVGKALRNTKHGQEVIGETEGVVPVVGDERREDHGPNRPS
ncbi:hypothetical protein MKUB_49960 [Mycobacterium kubicae]|uniref:PPE domain-containing protein n=1 Tax=Mycobacterium kubicae TaxID=120959 RepID=A0AAX1J7X6_9MYCO|nr:hypothetical protein [Mycobacterium kubicae]MCV7094677.1 hypothetical protein [Mycobacterium kubicae]OBF17682.1 hypothetical protein A5725_22610 [Mycobacterium kubicae]OBK56758.1 hypothetical protein A5657_09060 [Mycobacterium kubicae]ORV97645.1 hypothetical protein AWC13_15530 [Mycobacterium kubicae]QNI13017.1 hypothetical protein GAN18_19200 [Mycobacterium kubicae]